MDKQKGSKPRISWNYVCLPRVFGGLNICNLLVWNEVAILKSLWALASKKNRLWIKWVNDYYIKGADIMQVHTPSTISWMLVRILECRNLVSDWSDLNNWVVNSKFSVKRAYMDRIAENPKPFWRTLWCNNKASPRSVICLWQILQNRLPTKARLAKWGSTVILNVFCVNLR